MTTDPAEQIAAALARLRGPRPRPPWDADGGDRGPWARGGPHGFGGSRGENGSHERSGSQDHAGTRGGSPWGDHGHGRFGGPARLRLLEALAAASAPLTVSEAAAAIGVDQPRASRLVQQCVDQGLVRREADPSDARRTRIALTDQGAVFVRGFRGERRNAVRAALADFSDTDRVELARLLTKLVEAWPRG